LVNTFERKENLKMSKAQKNWENFHIDRLKDNFPKWPNEVMIRVAFGDYLSRRPHFDENSKVLDVGCGFAQNLLPFVVLGADCHGVEISESVVEVSRKAIADRGVNVNIQVGSNRSLPYPSDTFDLLMSIDTIHYEDSRNGMEKGLAEFARVLKPGGLLILTTSGSEHNMQVRGKRLAPNIWKIQNLDFRDGETMFLFEEEKTLNKELDLVFSHVETGRVTQRLMNSTIDWFIGTARKYDPTDNDWKTVNGR
jgi:SAM-dependent methyltransferase